MNFTKKLTAYLTYRPDRNWMDSLNREIAQAETTERLKLIERQIEHELFHFNLYSKDRAKLVFLLSWCNLRRNLLTGKIDLI